MRSLHLYTAPNTSVLHSEMQLV